MNNRLAAKHKKAGAFLREARTRRGLTLKEAMARIGLTSASSPQYLMRIEHGVQRIPFDHLDALCAVYRIDSLDVRQLYAQVEIDKIKAKYGLK